MLDDALFITDAVHAQNVTLADGSEHVFYFKELGANVWRRYAVANTSDDVSKQEDAMPALIAAGLCDKDGKLALTLERARKLKPQVMISIYNAMMEVNQMRPKEQPTGDSGTS